VNNLAAIIVTRLTGVLKVLVVYATHEKLCVLSVSSVCCLAVRSFVLNNYSLLSGSYFDLCKLSVAHGISWFMPETSR